MSAENPGRDVARAIEEAFVEGADNDGNVYDALGAIASALRALGNNDAATSMGGLEALGLSIREAAEDIAGGLRAIADAIEGARS